MPAFQRKVTAEQRKAIFQARFEHGHTYAEVHRRATEGELDCGKVDVSLDYIGRLCRNEEKRRALRFRSPLADRPHRDAIEELRRGLIAAGDDMLTELRGRKAKDQDPERARQIARLVREASAIPIPKADTPLAPGAKQDGRREGAETKGGTAGSLLSAHRNGTHDHTNETDTTHTQDQTPQQQGAGAGSGSLTHTSAERVAA